MNLKMALVVSSYFYHYDGQGNVAELTDLDGELIQRASYEAFGSLVSLQNDEVANPYLFSTKEFEPQTGLSYFGARYYDPRVGRFVSPDPAGFIDGPNLYAFVSNNPVNLVDPLGLRAQRPARQAVFAPSQEISQAVQEQLDAAQPRRPTVSRPQGPIAFTSPWWREVVVPGPVGQPMSEWGPTGPTAWGDPMKYTDAAGGVWKWAERIAVGTAVAATGAIIASPIATAAFRRGGWLNSNPYLRIGWGQHEGQRVFRIAGKIVERITGRSHLDLWRGGRL